MASKVAAFTFQCRECDYDTGDPIELADHCGEIHGFAPFFVRPSNETDRHVRDEARPFRCPFCPYSAAQRHHMTDHLKARHLKIKDVSCQFCHFKTNRAHILRNHVNGKQGQATDYEETTTNASRMARIPCQEFSQERTIEPAEETEEKTGIPLRKAADGHKDDDSRGKINEESTNSLNCPEDCGYTTSVAARMKRHVRSVHKSGRPFACQECKFLASHIMSLKYHISAVHRNLRPFKCRFCPFTAKWPGDRSKHVKAHHT